MGYQERKIRRSITLDKSISNYLDEYCKKEKIAVSHIINKILKQWSEKWIKHLKR